MPVPLRREAESGDELFASAHWTIVPEAGDSAVASACGPQRAVGIVRDLLASTVRLLAQTRIWIGGGAGFDPALFSPTSSSAAPTRTRIGRKGGFVMPATLDLFRESDREMEDSVALRFPYFGGDVHRLCRRQA
jgi:hypothetical protein